MTAPVARVAVFGMTFVCAVVGSAGSLAQEISVGSGEPVYGRFFCTIEAGEQQCGVGSFEDPLYDIKITEPGKILIIHDLWVDTVAITGQNVVVTVRVRWTGKRPPNWTSQVAFIPMPLNDIANFGGGMSQFAASRHLSLYVDAFQQFTAHATRPVPAPRLVNVRFMGLLVDG